MPSRVPSAAVLLAVVVTGISETLTPGTFVQTSLTTELPVSKIVTASADPLTPTELLAVSITWKVPARVGVPLSKPLAELNVSPGGRGAAVYWAAELAPTTVKLNGWLMKPTAVSGLMTAAADCVTLVGYSRLLGMTCLDWLGLYHERWATSELVVW